MGDRRDFFAAETDLWEMVTRIAEGRKARELDPTMAMLRQSLSEARDDKFISATVRDRIAAMHGFVDMVDRWAGEIRRVPRGKLTALMRLGATIARFLPARRGAEPDQPTGTSPLAPASDPTTEEPPLR